MEFYGGAGPPQIEWSFLQTSCQIVLPSISGNSPGMTGIVDFSKTSRTQISCGSLIFPIGFINSIQPACHPADKYAAGYQCPRSSDYYECPSFISPRLVIGLKPERCQSPNGPRYFYIIVPKAFLLAFDVRDKRMK